MKIIYYDCFSGISGDMNLSAMIDLGVDFDYLKKELSKLPLDNYKLSMRRDIRKGISGTKIDIITDKTNEHKGINDIENIILLSKLSENVKNLSMKMFNKIADAEASIHNVKREMVHFHEVGAIDSIIDIVGAAICFDFLKPDAIFASPVQLGGGFVKCMHGMYPVPAPAVACILNGIPIRLGAMQCETTTPTGAAILKSNVDSFTEKKDFIIKKTAYGIGNRDNEIPNVLRVYLGETEDDSGYLSETAFILECNIDDMSPEKYDYIINLLLKSKAQDVFLTPIIMKKSRPAVKLNVLCKKENISLLENIIFKETTTLGIRKYQVEKDMLFRNEKKIHTKFGDITIKEALMNGEIIKFKPEYDQCVNLAEKNNVSLLEITNEINKIYLNLAGDTNE